MQALVERELPKSVLLACRCNPTAISLKAGCELFLRYTTRTSAIENEDFATAKARIIEVRLEGNSHSIHNAQLHDITHVT